MVSKDLKFTFGRVENIVGEGENAGNQHFSPFPTMFSTNPKFLFLSYIDSVVCKCFGPV